MLWSSGAPRPSAANSSMALRKEAWTWADGRMNSGMGTVLPVTGMAAHRHFPAPSRPAPSRPAPSRSEALGQFLAGVDAEPLVDVPQVVLHGLGAEEQRRRGLPGRLARGQQQCDLQFLRGE